MSKTIQMVGQQFGELIVIAQAEHSKGSHRKWLCSCSCGRETTVATNNLRSGHTRSCGCLVKTTASNLRTKHGMSKTRVYDIWLGMMSRCFNPKNISYSRYGAAGITVCPKWRSYTQFISDMGMPPGDRYSLDRLDNTKGYCADNCRWATSEQQANNKRNNRVMTTGTQTLTLAQWAKLAGMNPTTLAYRLDKGYPLDVAISSEFKTLRKACRREGLGSLDAR